jgi:hypothetical protein
MHILLFIFYSLLTGYGILRIPFIRKSGIRPAWLLLFFAVHVLLGCLHNMIAWRFYPGHGDIWDFFERSLLARRLITADPHVFLEYNANWNYLTHNNIIWVHLLLNFLSLDNIYINTLLFSFPVFLGNIALFRVMRRHFPGDPLTALTVLVFPSTLFWTACVHREGAVYGLLGFLFYYMDRLLASTTSVVSGNIFFSRPGKLRWTLLCFLLFIAALYFRPAVALTLLPALLAWWLFEKTSPHRKTRTIIAAIGAAVLVLLFIIPGVTAPLLQALSIRQKEFQALEGGSRLYLPLLEPSRASFLRVLPIGVRNGLFEPLPGSGGKIIYEAFSIELLVVWGIIAVAILRKALVRQPAPPSTSNFPFYAACLLFALPGMILVGMIVPFAGSIVRYRSIFLPFLLAPFLHSLHLSGLIRRLNKSLSTRLMEP